MKYIPIIVPCAGKGSRSGLNSPKSLYVHDGKTILESIINKCIIACEGLNLKPHFYIVIRDYADDFINILSSYSSNIDFTLVEQPYSDGTADAVNRGVVEIINESESASLCVLIWGDCIGFKPKTLVSTIESINGYSVVVPGFHTNNCYTVFEVNQEKMITSCSETKDSKDRIVGYTDIGMFSFRPKILKPYLDNEVISASQSGGESSFIKVLSTVADKIDCLFLDKALPVEKKGFNSPNDL